jgi:hypothetical protein
MLLRRQQAHPSVQASVNQQVNVPIQRILGGPPIGQKIAAFAGSRPRHAPVAKRLPDMGIHRAIQHVPQPPTTAGGNAAKVNPIADAIVAAQMSVGLERDLPEYSTIHMLSSLSPAIAHGAKLEPVTAARRGIGVLPSQRKHLARTARWNWIWQTGLLGKTDFSPPEPERF